MRTSGDQIHAFTQLLAAIASAPVAAQRGLAAAFIAEHPQSPLLGPDEAVIWYCGAGDAIILRGDMLQERSEPLTRLGKTTFHYHHRHYQFNALGLSSAG